ILLRSLLWPLAAFIVTIILLGILTTADTGEPSTETSTWLADLTTAGNFVVLFIMLVVGGWILFIYLDWHADHIIVRSQRVLVNFQRPLISRDLRDVPMGKVQNIVVHQAGLEHIVEKLFNVARLVIDTAGMGQIEYKGIALKDANEARARILALQGG